VFSCVAIQFVHSSQQKDVCEACLSILVHTVHLVLDLIDMMVHGVNAVPALAPSGMTCC